MRSTSHDRSAASPRTLSASRSEMPLQDAAASRKLRRQADAWSPAVCNRHRDDRSQRHASISDQLLRYADWTRRLARSLVANDALADDIAQETWLSALRRPPDTSEPLEPWLRTVVRHHAFNRARENSRREAREKQIERVEAAESTEDLLARLESHEASVETVTQLAEPYRQMILLRYFEGLSSTKIGARESLPPGTVRGRLKTALELLREALDERYGSRALWFEPIAALSHPPSTTGAVRGPSTRTPPRVQIAKWLARGTTAKLASARCGVARAGVGLTPPDATLNARTNAPRAPGGRHDDRSPRHPDLVPARRRDALRRRTPRPSGAAIGPGVTATSTTRSLSVACGAAPVQKEYVPMPSRQTSQSPRPAGLAASCRRRSS